MIWGYVECFLAGGLSGFIIAAIIYVGTKEVEDEERRSLARENRCLKIELEVQREIVKELGNGRRGAE